MEFGLRKKFASGTSHCRRLLDTPGEIVENNNWHDNFWGKCRCNNCTKRVHRNELGKLLMKIRDELLAQEIVF
jgi:predicted NAD-dependent protein-ADP-ribosyltransferase YbiA (DUF1768 family)